MTAWGPPWLVRALTEIGVREVHGERSNPRIVGYHAHTAAGEAPEETAWCASFLCAMLERSGFTSTNSKAADSWLKYGEKTAMRLGAIAVFGKTDPDAKGTGHCALIAGWNDRIVLALGGNQQNSVSVVPRPRDNIVDLRWPTGYLWP